MAALGRGEFEVKGIELKVMNFFVGGFMKSVKIILMSSFLICFIGMVGMSMDSENQESYEDLNWISGTVLTISETELSVLEEDQTYNFIIPNGVEYDEGIKDPAEIEKGMRVEVGYEESDKGFIVKIIGLVENEEFLESETVNQIPD